MAKPQDKKVAIPPAIPPNGQSSQPEDPKFNNPPAEKLPADSGAADQGNEPSFPIVGIVASAGGLDSFKSFFRAVRENCGMAFVLVPHLDSKRKSALVELLSRESCLPVVEATDGMRIKVDSVYVIPHNHTLMLSQGVMRLGALPDPIGARTAIDMFLRSLAEDQQSKAIGIVFSGTGSHGTLGIREIKRCGGMAMVQTPESSEFDQMPRSAIETGLVDFILPPAAMPEVLLRYVKQPYVRSIHANMPLHEESSAEPSATDLKSIFDLIRLKTKYDFRCYRPNMVMRRIERRMGVVQADGLESYTQILRSNQHELEALCNDFLIGVTSFFREPEAFGYLESELFPKLLASHQEDSPIRVWVPCCATGEEAYSIAMLLIEAFEAADKVLNVQVFASDISQRSISFARKGIYPESIATDIESSRLKRFFTQYDDSHYQVSKKLRESVVFSTQNVVNDAPFSRLDLISCRNLLIYLEQDLQQKLISLFHYALVEGGHILLGAAETVGRSESLFEPVSKKWRIYRRIGKATPVAISLPMEKETTKSLMRSPPMHLTLQGKLYKELTDTLLADYAPAAALINRHFEILYVSGSLVDYLEFPAGELSRELLAMARPGLRSRLRALCHNASQQRLVITDSEARVQRNGVYVACSITAHPILDSKETGELLLLVFRDLPPKQRRLDTASAKTRENETKQSVNDSTAIVQHLEHELKSIREDLQNTIEEMESSNEELQSSNEELESSKEELQSLNEELSTVNCQLLEKVAELDKSHAEINELMASTEIATLYLDKQFRIKRFTYPTMQLFNLLPTDEGRDIRDFASVLIGNDLIQECEQVLTDQKPVDSEMATKDQRCFLRRILPFRSADSGIAGVVITYVDMTELKQAEAEQRELDACFREIFEHAATGIAMGTLEGEFGRCNPAYCSLVGYSEPELRNTQLWSHMHPDDIQANKDWIKKLNDGAVSYFEIENRYVHKDGSEIWVKKLCSILPDGSGNSSRLLELVTNVSAQRTAVDALRKSEERMSAILKTASDAIVTIDSQGVIDSVNQATERVFGYASKELIGKSVVVLMPSFFASNNQDHAAVFLGAAASRNHGHGREVICQRKDGTTFPADLAVSQVDHLGLFTGILRDVSKRKEMQRHIVEIATNEQRRIGLELHDGTQQELSGLSLFASSLKETIGNSAKSTADGRKIFTFDEPDYDRLVSISDLISRRLVETNQHVRDLAHGIMPIQVDAEGLRSALADLANSINSNDKIVCQFVCKEDVVIPDNTTATHLYRIAQEAINNAIRHGDADQIRVALMTKDQLISLEVSDNGIGFNKKHLATHEELTSKGMGMRTMEYRASLIGGHILTSQSPEGGVTVRCELSIKDPR
jgi:two-component system, chemotaxis family, CheB/CheR fusion protein